MLRRVRPLRVVSWNVNGLRACAAKGFLPWLARARAHVVGVQEVRAQAAQLAPELGTPRRWHTHFVAAARKGYSGVGMFARARPDGLEWALGEPRFDAEGRIQIAHFGRLSVANVYFPKGSGTLRDNSRVPYKLAFTEKVRERLDALRATGQRVLVMGDFNTAHREVDLARPRQNHKNSGFLPEERAAIDAWLNAGWVDTFRAFEPGGGHYTWWRQSGTARAHNIGWRIDYVFACPEAMPFVERAFIWPEVQLSDHCPLGVDVRADITG
jgi:exodeoxyribonuclease-3